MTSSTDRIEKEIHLRAPLARVWRALADAQEFGRWFGVDIDGAFVEGERVRGRITNPGYEHVIWDVAIERMEPERVFSWRWHPHAIDSTLDYSAEQTTLVEFTLEPVDGGTTLRVVESGFDALPASRRDTAFRGNERGWAGQMKKIERHVADVS
ncbi:MAG: SRPBCC family protein [Gemmatimonadaceae bacterium]